MSNLKSILLLISPPIGVCVAMALGLFSLRFFIECQHDKPIFKIGDCVQFEDPDKESWENPTVVDRILEIGNQKYRTHHLIGIRFSSQKYYKKVKCPKE